MAAWASSLATGLRRAALTGARPLHVSAWDFMPAAARGRSSIGFAMAESAVTAPQALLSVAKLPAVRNRGASMAHWMLLAGPRGGIGALAVGAVRMKQTKRQAYHKAPRASPCGQRMPNKAHIGVKALSAEYVEAGRMICKQRKFIAKNPKVTRNRHFKLYPGVNVMVMKSTSLQAAVSGRVKMTHDIRRDVLVMNVLPEPREELLREDLWRYRTEHVECMEENKLICSLRAKALPVFGKEGGWINQPVGPKPMKVRISKRNDHWNNPNVQDPLEMEPFAYPLPRHQLARHIRKVRRKQAGLPDDDPGFEITDTRFHLFKGQTAQR